MYDSRLRFIRTVFALLIAFLYLFGIPILSADNRSQTYVNPGDVSYKEDINQDGLTNILDAIALLILGMNDPNNPTADYDADGKYSITDVISLIINIQNGKLTPKSAPPRISGRIILDGRGLNKIELRIKGADFELVVATDSTGTYRLWGSLSHGKYTVEPKENLYYTFSPESLEVLIGSVPVTVPDIEAIPVSNTLSGKVLENNIGLVGVTVNVKGPDLDTTLTTDSLGMYRLEGLFNASYQVVCQMENYTFNPYSTTVRVEEDFITVRNILATPAAPSPSTLYTLGGTIYCTTAPVANIQVFLIGDDMRASTITDGNGSFTFVVPNGNYLIVPLAFLEDQGFNPPSYNITVDGQNFFDLHFLAWGAPDEE